jgi:hypothetical protein
MQDKRKRVLNNVGKFGPGGRCLRASFFLTRNENCFSAGALAASQAEVCLMNLTALNDEDWSNFMIWLRCPA